MAYIIEKDGKMFVVFPTRSHPSYNLHDAEGKEQAKRIWESHLHSLESYPLPDNLSHLPLGEAKGLRKQWQVWCADWPKPGRWHNVSKEEYDLDINSGHRRIIPVLDEGEKDYSDTVRDIPLDGHAHTTQEGKKDVVLEFFCKSYGGKTPDELMSEGWTFTAYELVRFANALLASHPPQPGRGYTEADIREALKMKNMGYGTDYIIKSLNH